MSNRFQPPSEEELAARGLDKDGNPLKKAAKKAAPKKAAESKEEDSLLVSAEIIDESMEDDG